MSMTLNSVIKQLIPDQALGALDYWRFPSWRQSWNGPFNGQEGRTQLFLELLDIFQPDYIVETGTFRGTTTRFISEVFNGPIFTIEHKPRNAGFSRVALRHCRNVELHVGDSVGFMQREFGRSLPTGSRGLFYLDAHWGGSVPILEELQLIADNCRNAVAMIDDFRVPGEPDYKYDDYGPAGALTAEFIQRVIDRTRLELFYPALPAADETGMRRGCAVLAQGEDFIKRLRSNELLRE